VIITIGFRLAQAVPARELLTAPIRARSAGGIRMYDLTEKVALVTGAGGREGIGRAIATRLAAEGADVIVNDVLARPHADTVPEWGGLPALVREIEALGRRSLGVVADVSDAAQVERMVGQALEQFGRIDILVNNAGSRPGRDRVPVVELEEEAWDTVQRVNVKGTFLCSRAVARGMIDRGQGGKIINLSSVAGKRGMPRFAAYCASKFAVIGFTQCLAGELAPYGIQVNAICPGFVDTERMRQIAAALAPPDQSAEEHHAQMLEQMSAQTPLGRVAQAPDIARMAAFLASSEADYLTGLAITVSGGWLMS
jgi:NAD(P)-dependent dehydrogenase (short-subunit alcohol dehydrogenase family)